MDTRQEHGEPERREGLGGRVRRFVDSEISRVLDKDTEDEETGRGPAAYRHEPERVPEVDRDREPGAPYTDYTDASGRAVGQPATTTPVDPGYDTPGYGLSAPEPSVEEAGLGQSGGHVSDEAAADSSAERVGLLNDPAGLRARWQQVQGAFVDDPHHAVQEAGVLVEQTLQEIRENVTRGQISDPASTEELRMSFQRYREFFHRLLSA
ncbi:MAG: hypothetical protein JO309_14670 [Pseudonocardiales bacterium]|nr:hypothetical protein [Pseudonocardiales bacterium]MBV9730616.1 hypothetical protein [Pseudonocardiales bacterium]